MGNFNIFVCVCVCVCVHGIYASSTMLLESSHTFRSDMFMKADIVAVHKKICNILFK